MKYTHFVLILTTIFFVLLRTNIFNWQFNTKEPEIICPNTHIITLVPGGRLGNNIWEYMSLLAILHLCEDQFSLKPYLPMAFKQILEDLFENLDALDPLELPSKCLENYSSYVLENTRAFNKSEIFNNKDKVYLTLAKYASRYEDIIRYGIDKMKKELRFRQEHESYSYHVLSQIRKDFNMSKNNVIYVGMHYRGTDYVNFLKRNYGTLYHGTPDHKYYLEAMDYFTNRFNNVIFILISEDSKWVKQNFPLLRNRHNNTVLNPAKSDVINDLVLLSSCNHSIINYGTFGATSALFANGITFVYDLKLPLDYDGPTVALGLASILKNWYAIR